MSITATPITPATTSAMICSYSSLVNAVGFQLYGLQKISADVITDGVASASQTEKILRSIDKGLQFIYAAHRWSFLRPLVSITTYAAYSTGTITVDVSGNVTGTDTVFPSYSASANGWMNIPSVGSFAVATYTSGTALVLDSYTGSAITTASSYSLWFNTYSLPVDANGNYIETIEGTLSYPSDSAVREKKISKVPELDIRQMLARSSQPGDPRVYALTTGAFDPTTGSTRCVSFYPPPESAVTLTGGGVLVPIKLDGTNQYPLGGSVLAGCIEEACLAAAERDLDDAEGVHNRALVPLLALAIQRDKEYASPDTLGIDHGQEPCDELVPRRSTSIYWNAGGGYEGYL